MICSLYTFLETSATICPSRILMIRNERWTMQSQMYRLRTCRVTFAANIFNDNNKLIIIYCPYVVSTRYNLSLQGSQSQAGMLSWSGISQSWGLCRLPPASTRSVAPLQQSADQSPPSPSAATSRHPPDEAGAGGQEEADRRGHLKLHITVIDRFRWWT